MQSFPGKHIRDSRSYEHRPVLNNAFSALSISHWHAQKDIPRLCQPRQYGASEMCGKCQRQLMASYKKLKCREFLPGNKEQVNQEETIAVMCLEYSSAK